MLLPHMKQFVAEWQTPARTYRFSFDEALKRSKTDALAMRRDGHILSLLQARLLPVLGADWCVKSEDDQYKDQATLYQKLIEKTPRLLQLRKCLLEAVWFGRYGVQFAFGKVDVDGRSMTGITAWKPVNGDKINFREDGTPTIRIMPSFAAKLREQGATVEEPTNAPVTAWNDQGTVLILDKPEYRSRFAIHIHEIEDADFAEPELAGSVGGVGMRHYCYWVWWLRQEIMEWLLSYLEMMGAGGLTIVGYDMSNPNGLNQAKAAFKERATVVYLPIPPGQDKQTNIVQRVEPSGTGNDIFSGWVDGYFNAILTRLIIGQDLSSSSNSTGLGSGVADLQASVKECIHRYDAKNLNETETQQILDVLIQMNEPRSSYCLKCQTVLQKVDPEKGLQAAKQAYDMGASLPESHVLQLANIPEVKDGEKTLTNPQLAHEAGLASMYESQQQGGTMGLEEARSMLAEQGIPEEEQLHHLADMVENGELEEIDADGGVQYAQPRQQQVGDDKTEPLDEPQEEPQTYAKEDWREETGPKGGRRWVNTKSGRVQYKEPGDGRTKGWQSDGQEERETDSGKRSIGSPRKGMLTQGAYQTLDKALRGESSKTLQGEGVLSHVIHADKRLLKDQVVSLAAQHGMQIDSRTTKTRALAYIEDKLRTHVSKGKADGSAKSGGEAKQAGSGGDGTGDAAPVASGSGGGSGGGDTGPRSVDTVSAQSEQTAVAESQAEPSSVGGADGGDDLGVDGGQHHKMVDSSLGSAKLGDEVKKKYGDAAKSVHGKLPQAAKDRLEKNLKGFQFHESSDALTKTLTDKSPSLKAKLGDKKAGGAFSKKTGELHLDGGTNIDGQKATHEEVYAHEYAHAIDGSDHELSKHQDWHAAWKAEAGEVSKYAMKTPQEGFAEFGRLAYTSGLSNDQLKEKFPKMSEYWEKNELLQEAGGKGGDLVESGPQMEDVFSEPFDSGEVIGDKPLMKQAEAGSTQESAGEVGDDSFDFGANEKPFEPAPKVDAGELPKRGKESLKEYLDGLGASEAHDSLRDYAKQLHETAKTETKMKNAAIGYAAKLISQYGDKPLTKNHKAFVDGDMTQLPRFDEVTSAVDSEHPGILHGDEQEKGQQLFEMLKGGTQSATPLAAFEDQALQEWHEAGRPLPQSKQELAEAAKPDPFKSTNEENEAAFDKFAAKAKSGGLNIPDDFREQPGAGAVSGKPVERDTMAMLQAKMKRENEQVKPKAAGNASNIEYVRAPAGGQVSEVDGKHYKGGQLMPIHGLSPKKQKGLDAGSNKAVAQGNSEQQKEWGSKQARQPMTPEQIQAEKERREELTKWNSVRSGAIGRINQNMGDSHHRETGVLNLKNWKQFAEEQGEESMQEMSWKMEQEYNRIIDEQAKNNSNLKPDQIEWARNEPRRQAEQDAAMHGAKKHLGAVPSSFLARHLAQQLISEKKGIQGWHEVNQILSGGDFEADPATQASVAQKAKPEPVVEDEEKPLEGWERDAINRKIARKRKTITGRKAATYSRSKPDAWERLLDNLGLPRDLIKV